MEGEGKKRHLSVPPEPFMHGAMYSGGPRGLLPKFFSASLTRLLVFKTLAWALGRGLDPWLRLEERGDTVTTSFLRKGGTDPTLGGGPFLSLFPRGTPCPGGWADSRRPLLSPGRRDEPEWGQWRGKRTFLKPQRL